MSYDGRIQADARHLPIADESVQCVVTSPPYWGLRDYGVAGQIGLERTPDEYVDSMLQVFREVWRVLRQDGTLWLNLGDCYAANRGGTAMPAETLAGGISGRGDEYAKRGRGTAYAAHRDPASHGLKHKDLIGIPWRVAFALQADGWYLRSDVIWAKPNPMPESVTDRPTRAHEYLFLLAKSERYFYDAAAIKEASTWDGPNSPGSIKSPYGQGFTRRAGLEDKQRGHSRRHAGFNERWDKMSHEQQAAMGRNKRSVWTVSTAPYPEAHYATFPPALIEPCILAGSKPGDFVLDPFFGSGTVGRVCEQFSRRWIGVDLGYQDLQEKRLQNLQKVLV